MRLGKDVLETDLYGELGLLPDATESEIRVAYRQRARASHPDLNQHDPDAMPRMKRLNMAAKVLLDPALRRAYDRMPRMTKSSGAAHASSSTGPTRKTAWFERDEQSADNDWSPPPPAEAPPPASSVSFFGELRSRDGQLSLQLQQLVDSLSVRQQIGIAALLCAVAVGLFAFAHPKGLVDDENRPLSVDVSSLYP